MSKTFWGGRFKEEIDKDFFDFQKSIYYDYKLANYDIKHSILHVIALKEAGLLKGKEPAILLKTLDEINKEIDIEIKEDIFKAEDAEDIHTVIQNRVEKKIGKLALKLHTLRSRNDQIAFDERYYCADKAFAIAGFLLAVLRALLERMNKYRNKYFIGYTHMQRAQVVLFPTYLFAYGDMFLRDEERLRKFYDNLSIYIGAGALTGTSLERGNYTKAIKEFLKKVPKWKIEVTENSLDNVSDRDFIIEFLNILAILQMHLSRFAEDIILYSTKEFNFIILPEKFCTGSSLMPHKKNPDFLELVRGYSGRVYGNLISVLTLMKGLPLTYNRDMQLDKEPLFSSVEIIEKELSLMPDFIKNIKLNTEAIEKVLDDKTLYATELADWLVREQKVPFKPAHDIAGKLTVLIEKNKGDIEKIKEEEFKKVHPSLDINVIKKLMNPKYAILSKKTVPKNKQILGNLIRAKVLKR